MTVPLTFLVASPHLHGSLFGGAVILLLEHDTSGAMGLLLTAPLHQSVAELLPDLPGGERGSVWSGGPVEPGVGWCLYRTPLKLEGEVRLAHGLCVTSSLDVLHAVAASGQDYLLLLGYAGWAAGQLTEEAREGTWLWVEQDTPELVWDVPAASRWQSALDRLGVKPGTIMPGGAQA
ncbi:YqgE/AlgH family protein [Deinococcus hopiensis]|uniref:Putative transcriptional regulator n=1 Tax=Deinococcus hopiensis KR-140 TaxID=695939 RepID=A0A1W1VPW0_9DEIO|nr:YqgE/AlgH family protein [Deinococcus hopiensis]SMB95111.1 putative transcriptional regulator [Deinococcus hopiensis KR-140]